MAEFITVELYSDDGPPEQPELLVESIRVHPDDADKLIQLADGFGYTAIEKADS